MLNFNIKSQKQRMIKPWIKEMKCKDGVQKISILNVLVNTDI